MNYYEHHIGDYAKDAGHLSMVEEGAYRRLLDAYYGRERALPTDVRECCKLAKAATKPERDAVSYVLREFFVLQDDGYHQKRAEEEIARFQDKQRKAKASANARWSKCERNANASDNDGGDGDANALRTHCEGNAPRARPQSPVTRHQTTTPERSSLAERSQGGSERAQEAETPKPEPTAAGTACRLMRQAGCAQTNPSHPDLLAAIAEGVTPEALADTAREAVEKQAGRPFAWAIATARSRHAQGARTVVVANVQPIRAGLSQPSKTMQGLEALEAMKRGTLVSERNPDRAAEAVHALAGPDARR